MIKKIILITLLTTLSLIAEGGLSIANKFDGSYELSTSSILQKNPNEPSGKEWVKGETLLKGKINWKYSNNKLKGMISIDEYKKTNKHFLDVETPQKCEFFYIDNSLTFERLIDVKRKGWEFFNILEFLLFTKQNIKFEKVENVGKLEPMKLEFVNSLTSDGKTATIGNRFFPWIPREFNTETIKKIYQSDAKRGSLDITYYNRNYHVERKLIISASQLKIRKEYISKFEKNNKTLDISMENSTYITFKLIESKK